MAYLIRMVDKPGSAAIRAATRSAHLEYIKPHVPRILAAGGFLEDDGAIGAGGIILLDVESRAEAEQLVAQDPYNLAGVFETVEITRWRKVIFAGALVA